MTDKVIHTDPQPDEPTKQSDDNYGLLFPKLFTPTIEDTEDGGKIITWSLRKGPKSVQGWVYLQLPKKGWRNKPIMPLNTYSITSSNLDKIHEFMDKYIIYKEDSPTKVRQYFVNLSRELLKGGGNS